MQLIGLVARHHRVTPQEAQRILWRRCISPRVRLTLFLIGWFTPNRRSDLKTILRGFGRCESYAGAKSDILFYKTQQADRGTTPASILFGFSGRRMLAVAKAYFDAAPEPATTEPGNAPGSRTASG